MSKAERPAFPNRLLAALPASVVSGCERIDLRFAQVLNEIGDPIKHVYFPLDGYISLVATLESGEKLEIGLVGDEGMLGAPLIMGVKVASHHALVQGAGTALRMNARTFMTHLKGNAVFQLDLHRYVCIVMRQLALTAACGHFHDTGARLARWLLLTRDRAHADQFNFTHEFMSQMLGVRRVGITEAATALQKRGLIEYRRGHVSILNGAGLEDASCPCYKQATSIYDQVMPSRSRNGS